MKLTGLKNKHIGILGGGQLGKMLINRAQQWALPVKFLDKDPQAVCSKVCKDFVVGNLLDYQSVLDFGKKVDILTIEIENVNTDALAYLEDIGIEVYPQAQVLSTIQNKATQKKFYTENNIPTAKYGVFDGKENLIRAIESKELNLPFIWKKATLGYDGYGVKKIENLQDIEHINDGQCIAEEIVNITKELSVIVCRNTKGETAVYPVAEMEFNKSTNQVEYVICPSAIDTIIKSQATEIALKVSSCFKHVGLLAVEMFLKKDNQVLVNEVAPRPHNSGHHTIEGSYTSQYEQHLRAILGLPLGSTKIKNPTVMVNLVGENGNIGNPVYQNLDKLLSQEGINVHIYGKEQTHPNRKMGHVTIIGKDINEAYSKAKKVKQTTKVISE